MRIIFKKACVFNGHKRVVGMITNVVDQKKLNDLLERGLAEQYNGEYPPTKKTKYNLKKLR